MDEALAVIAKGLDEELGKGSPQRGVYKWGVDEMAEHISNWMDSYKEGGTRADMVPTISALAFEIGTTRDGIMDYSNRDAYSEMFKRAKTFAEMHVEQKLYDPSIRPAGPIFNLKANFGHKDGNENKNVNFNFSWNSVQQEAAKLRKSREADDLGTEEPIDI